MANYFHIAGVGIWALGMDGTGPTEIRPLTSGSNGQVALRYANGVEVVHGNSGGIQFIGSDGEITVNRGKLESKPADIVKIMLTDKDVQLYKSKGHQRDWLDCIRSRRKPICDVEIGARSVTVCHLGNLAYWNHRKLRWDPKNWQFVGEDGDAK